jgi:hypothetical protein
LQFVRLSRAEADCERVLAVGVDAQDFLARPRQSEARLAAVIVLPTPPFLAPTKIVLPILTLLLRGQNFSLIFDVRLLNGRGISPCA